MSPSAIVSLSDLMFERIIEGVLRSRRKRENARISLPVQENNETISARGSGEEGRGGGGTTAFASEFAYARTSPRNPVLPLLLTPESLLALRLCSERYLLN